MAAAQSSAGPPGKAVLETGADNLLTTLATPEKTIPGKSPGVSPSDPIDHGKLEGLVKPPKPD
jgi:hypothetical protein